MSARSFFFACVAALVPCAAARATALESALATPLALIVQGGNASFAIPANDGWVTDRAHLLTPAEERELETSLETFKRTTGHEIAVLTVPDLGGRTIEEYALGVLRAWKIGSVERNDGALLVIAKNDRKLRIEVDGGLEGTLTDAQSSRIIRDTITPAFKAGHFGEGVRAGVAAMIAAAAGRAGSAQTPGPGGNVVQQRSSDSPLAEIGGLLCPLLMIALVVIVMSRLARRGGLPRRRGWGGFGPFVGGGGFGGFSGGGGFGGGGGGFSGFGGGGRGSGGGASGGW